MTETRPNRQDLRGLRQKALERRMKTILPAKLEEDPRTMKDVMRPAPTDTQDPNAQGDDWVRIRRRTRADRQAADHQIDRDDAGQALDHDDASQDVAEPSDLGRVALVPAAPRSEVVETPKPARGKSQPDAWENLARIRGARGLSALALSADIYDAEPLTQGFDLLRTRLMQTMRSHGWRKVAIATPRHGGGATFTAVNLALSLAKVPGSRTVLMDLNQRKPGVAPALGLRQKGSIHEFLKGEVALEDHLVRASDTLVLGMTDDPFAQSAEVFHDPTTELVLEDMYDALNPDLVIYDLPPALLYDDLAAMLPLVDGVLLVSDGTETTAEDITACERILESQVPLLGVVLNRARSKPHRNKWF